MSLDMECMGGPLDGEEETVSGFDATTLPVHQSGTQFIIDDRSLAPVIGIYTTDFSAMVLRWEPLE